MKLKELIALHEGNQLPEDLKKGWVYEQVEGGFVIHCYDQLGGIKYTELPDSFTEMNGNEFRLYRLINGSEQKLFYHSDNYSSSYEEEIEHDLSHYHVGLANHLREIFGY